MFCFLAEGDGSDQRMVQVTLGSPTGDTVNPHLDLKEAGSDGQPSRPWSDHSPLPRLLMSPEDRTQRACSVGVRARITRRHDFLGVG